MRLHRQQQSLQRTRRGVSRRIGGAFPQREGGRLDGRAAAVLLAGRLTGGRVVDMSCTRHRPSPLRLLACATPLRCVVRIHALRATGSTSCAMRAAPEAAPDSLRAATAPSPLGGEGGAGGDGLRPPLLDQALLRGDVSWTCRGRVVGVSWACRGRVVDLSWTCALAVQLPGSRQGTAEMQRYNRDTAELPPSYHRATARDCAALLLCRPLQRSDERAPAPPARLRMIPSAASRLPLGCLSAVSRLSLGCLSAVSRLHLGCISRPPSRRARP